MNGKGSKPRPLSIKRDDYDARWEAAFGKKKPCTAQKTKTTNMKTRSFSGRTDAT